MDYSKWMKNLDGNLPLSLISIPGTHDSCSNNICFKYISKCHDKTITEQLNSGVRFLDIRIALGKNGINTVHSILNCKKNPYSFDNLMFSDVFNDVRKFLKINKSETVIMCLKRDWGKNDYPLYKHLFDDFIEPYRNLWFCGNRIPTLNECRGKIVLMLRNSLPEYFMYKKTGLDFSSVFYGDADCTSAVIKTNYNYNTIIQDNYNISPKKKYKCTIIPFFDKHRSDKNTFIINFLSCNDSKHSPKKSAEFINEAVFNLNLEKGHYGIVVFDFVKIKYCKKIIELNF